MSDNILVLLKKETEKLIKTLGKLNEMVQKHSKTISVYLPYLYDSLTLNLVSLPIATFLLPDTLVTVICPVLRVWIVAPLKSKLVQLFVPVVPTTRWKKYEYYMYLELLWCNHDVPIIAALLLSDTLATVIVPKWGFRTLALVNTIKTGGGGEEFNHSHISPSAVLKQ